MLVNVFVVQLGSPGQSLAYLQLIVEDVFGMLPQTHLPLEKVH